MTSQDSIAERRTRAAWDSLRRFARRPAVELRCELCGLGLSEEHEHLVEPATGRLLCACQACAILFSEEQAELKYRRVPRQIRLLRSFRLSDAQWEGLRVPIGLAFFVHRRAAGRIVAIYPSPAGPTESLLEFASWDEIVHDNPILQRMEADTEALLVHRVGDVREHYLAPIDQCYKLVGLIRAHWQGFSGGAAVWREIEGFFAALTQRSASVE